MLTTTTSDWAGMTFLHHRVAAETLERNIVLPPSATTRTLARLIVQRRCRAALDIGTGCGALALLIARLADEVIATDVNPLALEFATRNAEVNGVSNVTWVEGSLTEPVDDRRFDLVVGNLPFVISPQSSLTFRDGEPGRPRDGARAIGPAAVAAAAGVLAPDGIAQFLMNWVVTDRARPFDAPVGWVRNTECGGLVLLHSLQSPDEYITSWAKSPTDDTDEWAGHLRDSGAVAVANGVVVLHRSTRPVVRATRMSSPRGRGGDQVERILTTERPTDVDLLTGRPRLLAAGIEREPSPDGHAPGRVRLVDTCGVTGVVPVELIEVIERLDGQTTIDAAVAASASSDAQNSAADTERITMSAVRVVRQLVLGGMMELDAIEGAD
jgi:SAM-dependent methyltransferase